MSTPNTALNPNPAPSAVAPAPSAQTPNTVPANPSAGGGKLPETVPYHRFQEVNAKAQRADDLEEENRILRSRLAQPKPNPQTNSSQDIPDAETDPVGHLIKRVDQQGAILESMLRSTKASEGQQLLEKIKTDYPVFANKEIGDDALEVLHARLNSADVQNGIKTPARVIREVAEKFSNLVVNSNNAVPQVKAAAANATASLQGSNPDVGAVQPAPAKPKSFDEAHKMAKSRWDSLAQKIRQTAQV